MISPLLCKRIALLAEPDTISQSGPVIIAMRKIKAESGQSSGANKIQNTDYHSNVTAWQPCADSVQPPDFFSF